MISQAAGPETTDGVATTLRKTHYSLHMPQSDALSGADPGVGATLDRVIVVGTAGGRADRERRDIELDELEELARTLRTTVSERTLITLREPHPATFFRSGVVETMKSRIAALDRPAVLCND